MGRRATICRCAPPFFAAAAITALTACGSLVEGERWQDQLVADSPCFDVNLLDGLDEESSDELFDLFDCVNYGGHFESLQPTVDQLETPTRIGDSAAIELATMVNAMSDVDVDPWAISGVLVDALRAEDRPFDAFLDIALELIYGDRANRVRTETIELDDPRALRDGVVTQLAPVLPIAATAFLDDDQGTAAWAGDLVASPETKRWIWTLESLASSPHPQVRGALDELLVHVGTGLAATRSPGNDRWSEAQGDSLKDALRVFIVQEHNAMEEVSVAADAILSDAIVRDAIDDRIAVLYDAGNLEAVPAELAWLASVDVSSNPVAADEVSALYAFLRLLAEADVEVDCALDLWITEIDLIHIDNLAVAVLQILADMDPDAAQDGLGIIASLFDSAVTEWMLHAAVDLSDGTCTGLSHEMIDDLEAVDAITQPESYDVLVLVIDLLNVLKHGEKDHLPGTVQLFGDLYRAGGVPPLEELIRDVGEEPMIDDIIDLVPVLAAPDDHGVEARGEPAADLQDMLDLTHWLFSVDPDTGLRGHERLRPLLLPILTEDATWDAMDTVSDLLSDDRTQLSQSLDLLVPLIELDPELVLLDEFGPLLADRRLSDPLLRILERGVVQDTLLAIETVDGQQEVPLTFLARMVVRGTLDDLLAFVDIVLASFDTEEDTATQTAQSVLN